MQELLWLETSTAFTNVFYNRALFPLKPVRPKYEEYRILLLSLNSITCLNSYSVLVEFLDNLVCLFILDMVGKQILEFQRLVCFK